MKPYPAWICSRCGERYGRRSVIEATWHEGTCGVCDSLNVAVADPRDYGHLHPDWRQRFEADSREKAPAEGSERGGGAGVALLATRAEPQRGVPGAGGEAAGGGGGAPGPPFPA